MYSDYHYYIIINNMKKNIGVNHGAQLEREKESPAIHNP
jgi:hypothetical protein